MIEQYSTFSELPNEVLAVYMNAKQNPFLTRDWFELLLENCLTSSEQCVIFTLRQGLAVIVLPLVQDGANLGRFRSLSNFYTPEFDLLRSTASNESSVENILTELKSSKDIVELDLEPFARNDSFEALQIAMTQVGFVVFPYFRFGNWYLEIKGRSFDEYYNGLSSQLRNTIARKRKKMVREVGVQFKLYCSEGDLDNALRSYWQVYNGSWKKQEPFPKFIEGLVCLAARKKWLRLGVIYAGNEPAAVQFWLVKNDVAYIYKLAYDEKYSCYSPGSILSYELFKHVIEVDKVIEIDYLVGDDAYKRDWMEKRRERWGLYVVNPSTFDGKCLVYKEKMKRLFKKWFCR